MSEQINDGGPAFPFSYDVTNESNTVPCTGMSLRAVFAGQAMAAMLSRVIDPDGDAFICCREERARVACENADTLIAELTKEPNHD